MITYFRSATAAMLLAGAMTLAGCGGGGGGGGVSPGPTLPSTPQSATPTISTTTALNSAVVVKLASTETGAVIYYTVDGSTPTTASQVYQAPFLVASNVTVKAMAVAPGATASTVQSQSFSASIAPNTLVWADEFNNSTGSAIAPDSNTWGYDTGNSGFGNHELETYCAWGATSGGCDTSNPNAYVGTDGMLHVVARKASASVYTSARLKSQNKFSFQYGRVEFRARVPEAQGLWPAVWTLGNSIATVNWPASGEQDILERVNAAQTPDVNYGSIHGTGFTGTNLGATYHFPSGTTASDWHTYGMIWKPGEVSYYIDNPAAPYATYHTSDIAGFAGSVWPFDNGQSNFFIINLAVGGDWPGAPDGTTPFPSQMDIDYIRIYTN